MGARYHRRCAQTGFALESYPSADTMRAKRDRYVVDISTTICQLPGPPQVQISGFLLEMSPRAQRLKATTPTYGVRAKRRQRMWCAGGSTAASRSANAFPKVRAT